MTDDGQENQLTPMQRRVIGLAGRIVTGEPESILFQHTIFCQTSLPYRNPGDEVRSWERRNGKARLKIVAGEAIHPITEKFVPISLPFGSKPRLILAYLNGEALRQQSPEIEVDRSLSAFMRRLNLATHGRNFHTVKDQLTRLSAAHIILGLVENGEATTIESKIVGGFKLWFPQEDRQRVLWPSTVRLSLDYFDSLTRHAVPLDETAISALAHSAMGLDLYAWLAQRLHRIKPNEPAFITWAALKDQFGQDYERTRDFRRVFTHTIRLVWSQYQGARFELDDQGMMLWNSPAPIKGRIGIVARRPKIKEGK